MSDASDKLYGKDALEDALNECSKRGGNTVMIFSSDHRYGIRIVEQNKDLVITMKDKQTGVSNDRIFPIAGLATAQKEAIARDILQAHVEGIPVMWKRVLSPHLSYVDTNDNNQVKYYWDEAWDVIESEKLDRKVDKQKLGI